MSTGVDDRARTAMMTRLKNALTRGDDSDAREEAVRARLATSRPTLLPARTDLSPPGRVQLFIDQAKAVQTDVERIDSYDALPDTIAGYLRRHNLPMRLVKATDPHLDKADWQASLLDVKAGRPDPDDAVGLSAAFAGIAETGTLMLASDADHPMTLAFLPETAVVALPTERIARAYEDALHAFRAASQSLPRSINLITGPSRSGDIEQTLQLGAHGPKRLLIVLVDEAGDGGPIPDVDAAPSDR